MWLCCANVAASLLIWLAMALHSMAGISDRWVFSIFALPASLWAAATHPWTILTYMFAQADVLQLLFNMLWLTWFGRMSSDTDSDRTIITLYIGGGLLGGLSYLIAATAVGGGSFLMGSSAAILSLMVYTSLRQPDREVSLFLIGNVRLKWIAIVTIIITLLGATGIPAHCAHIGGALFPFILIAWRRLKRSRHKSSEPRRRTPKPLRNSKPLLQPAAKQQNQEQELDTLLDKIRISGFDSLSKSEKARLDEITKNLD